MIVPVTMGGGAPVNRWQNVKMKDYDDQVSL
jgi:hypothetical protein